MRELREIKETAWWIAAIMGATAFVYLVIYYGELISRAHAQSLSPGDLLYVMVPSDDETGKYEAHPEIILVNGQACDLMSALCMLDAENDFGTVRAKALRDRGIELAPKAFQRR